MEELNKIMVHVLIKDYAKEGTPPRISEKERQRSLAYQAFIGSRIEKICNNSCNGRWKLKFEENEAEVFDVTLFADDSDDLKLLEQIVRTQLDQNFRVHISKSILSN